MTYRNENGNLIKLSKASVFSNRPVSTVIDGKPAYKGEYNNGEKIIFIINGEHEIKN